MFWNKHSKQYICFFLYLSKMSSIQRLEKHLKNLVGGVSAMSISETWSGCPKSASSSGSSSLGTSSSAQSLSAFASLENRMAKCNQPASQGDNTTHNSTCTSTSTSSAQYNNTSAQSSENVSGIDNVEREIERANRELIREKTKSFEDLLKLITILLIKCSPLLLYLKLKYATCCNSRMEIANMLCGYKYLGMEVQKLDCFDEHALYILAAMKSYAARAATPAPTPAATPAPAQTPAATPAPTPAENINDPNIYTLLLKTHYIAQLQPLLKEAYGHVGSVEQTVISMLNSGAISIIKRKYKISAIQGVLSGEQLYTDIKALVQNVPSSFSPTPGTTVGAVMTAIEEGKFTAAKGGRKKYLKKPHKK